MAGKGGVGKSSVCSVIALCLGNRNKKVGIVDVDLCGPSIPGLLLKPDADDNDNAAESDTSSKIINTDWGWMPVKSRHYGIKLMSSQFLLNSTNDPVVWRGPRKTRKY